jgi:hypothetical protein
MQCGGKISYTKKEAQTELKRLSIEKGKHKKPTRFYQCTECGMCHLTSREYWSKDDFNRMDNYQLTHHTREAWNLQMSKQQNKE